MDPTFTLDRDRALAIAQAIRRLPFTLHWTCKTRVDHIDDALAQELAASGCYGIAFGVESGADLVLAKMKKKLGGRAHEGGLRRPQRPRDTHHRLLSRWWSRGG